MINNKLKTISYTQIKALCFAFVLFLLITTQVSAHLMVAQHGTIKLVGNHAFIVLSVPVSAFENIDDDNNGRLSTAEFKKYRPDIVKAVNQHIKLMDGDVSRLLEGMLLSPVIPHGEKQDSAKQLIVMGMFTLSDINHPIKFHAGLFGKQKDEQRLTITTTNTHISSQQTIVLSPKQAYRQIFSNQAVNLSKS